MRQTCLSSLCSPIKNKEMSSLNFLDSKGISCGIHYPVPCHLQKCYSALNYTKGSMPFAEKFSEILISLPMYPELTDEQIKYTSATIKNFYNNITK